MIIGVPKEIKTGEYRVAMTPEGVQALAQAGHSVRIQSGAGEGSGFPDQDYMRAGAALASSAAKVWSADLVIKVKEPLASEYRFFRPGQILFTFLHLAPNRTLTQALMKKKVLSIAYEAVEDENNWRPILRAMSEIAGRVAVVMGNYFQGNPQGGRGVLYGGATGVAPAEVVILGGGVVGEHAAQVYSRMGARVTVLESFPNRRVYLEKALPEVSIGEADPDAVRQAVLKADVLIGALHIPGAKTPRLVTRQMVRQMKRRSVIIDVAIDQGGSCETSRPTTHVKPTYVEEGVIHYCVPNMPGAYARTATEALTHVTLAYILTLAGKGVPGAFKSLPGLAVGVQTYQGHLTCEPVAAAHKWSSTRLSSLI